MIVEITDKEASPKLARPIQDALDKEVPGAWVTVRQLQTNPVDNPVELLISGQADVDARNEASDIRTLRQIAAAGSGHRQASSAALPFFAMIGSLTMFSRGFRSIQTAPTWQPSPTPMWQTRQLRP